MEARLPLEEGDLEELVVRQAGLLDDAASLVRNGGRLVYATCSLFAEENEGQVSAFLGRHAAFALVPLARAWPLVVSPHVGVPSGELPSGERPGEELPGEELPGAGPLCAGETLVLTPRQHGTDGFFAAVLERAV